MDPALLTSQSFWNDPSPFAWGEVPDIPELTGHVLFETSGSSGTPRWIALSKQALLVSAAAVNRHLGVTRESCWGLALPLNHVGGFGVAARTYEAGCRMCHFEERWEPRAFREWLERSQVTHASLVPTQVHDLVKANLTAPMTVTAIVVGGGQLDRQTGRIARSLGWPVLASYGMTEAGSQIATQELAALNNPYEPAPILLLPIWEAEISLDRVLAISGPALFSGHVIGGKFVCRESEWHMTSDLASLEHRLLTPLGRADSLVKVLGELVDPEAIERELVALSEGALSSGFFAVIAVPDERSGNALIAVFESSAELLAAESALSLYGRKAPGFRRLKQAVVIGEFPRSELGKLRRKELTAIYQQSLTTRHAPPA